MSLTDTKIRNTKPSTSPFKLTDYIYLSIPAVHVSGT